MNKRRQGRPTGVTAVSASRQTARAGRIALAATALLLAGCTSGGGPTEPGQTDSNGTPVGTYAHYVALGDSYTSAPGVPGPAPGPCGQSTSNYPRLVAAALGTVVEDRSCSGAYLKHLVESHAPGVGPQLDWITSETDLVTMSMGANPTAYGVLVYGCAEYRDTDPVGAPCQSAMRTESGGDRILDALVTQRPELESAVDRIRAKAPDARVVLVGYPAVFPTSGSCPDRLPLAEGDLVYADSILRAVNAELERVAVAKGVEYVDPYERTLGHDMCAEDPWIQGKDTVEGEALLYHPRAEEQQAVADLLIELLR